MSSLEDQTDKTDDDTSCGPFALGAPLYRPLWPGVIHIPEDRKKEPPTGFTGFKGRIADNEQFAEWIDVKADRNIAIWLGFQIALNGERWVIVAIDVDNYDDKLGGSQLAELVKKLGPLPDTWLSSSRIDGISGIRYFRVRYDPNLRLRNVAEHIETIYFGWRYAMVWPSVVEGRQYWWFPPGVLPDENGRAAWKPESGIPDPATFPELPKPWFDHILRTDVNGSRPGGAVTDAEVTGFVAEHDNPATPRPGALAAIVEDFHLSRNGQKKFEGRIVNRTDRNANQVFLNRHDAEFSSLCRVARGSLVGKFGATEGKERIEAASRQECEVRGEIFKLYDFEHNWRDAIRRALEKPFQEVYEQEFRPGKDFDASGLDLNEITLLDTDGNVVDVIPAYGDPLERDREIDKDFWEESRAGLKDIRQFARSRRVGPWSKFITCAAMAGTAIPPNVVLPPEVGSHASLNLFACLVGESGRTKSMSIAAARDYLTVAPVPVEIKPGTGEGLASCYAHVESQNGTIQQIGDAWSTLVVIPEVESLTKVGARSGNTLLSELRSAWSGERLGHDYKAINRLTIKGHRYRMDMIVAAQPINAASILDDVAGGTPQRFLWLPVSDRERPRVRPDEPRKLTLDRWPSLQFTPGQVVDPCYFFPSDLDKDADPAEFEILSIPQSVQQEIDQHSYNLLDEDFKIDPLDSHKYQLQLKMAANLMWLDSRSNGLSIEDWELAGLVIEKSILTRNKLRQDIDSNENLKAVKHGFAVGIREDVAEQTKTHRAVKRVAENIVKALKIFGGEAPRSLIRDKKIAHRDRDYFDDAEESLISKNRIEKEPADNTGGPDGFVLRLVGKGKAASK
jgi:hypothetical protein